MSIQNFNYNKKLCNLTGLYRQMASATAHIKGSSEYPSITGDMEFIQTEVGVLISIQVTGLPSSDENCKNHFFGFHIHSGNTCTGNSQDAFADVKTHYNPENCDHPNHAGDLLPILGNHGYAFEVFLTDRFSVDEIIGKTAVIHLNQDDFTTQPSGNAGAKIACGEIMRICRRN